MGDFDSWLSNAISLAGDVGKEKRKQFYDAEKFKVERQFGNVATPYGPGYEEQKLKNVGSKYYVDTESKAKLDVARMDTEAKSADRALIAPKLQAENLKIAREDRVNQVAKQQDLTTNRKESKSLLGMMEKSSTAQNIIENNQPGLAGRAWNFVRGLTTSAPSIQERTTDFALEKQGVSRADVLTPEQWTSVGEELKKRKINRERINAF